VGPLHVPGKSFSGAVTHQVSHIAGSDIEEVEAIGRGTGTDALLHSAGGDSRSNPRPVREFKSSKMVPFGALLEEIRQSRT
jgi:hypothetical protein